MKDTKYIFITGGVVSSLGKGITASTIGRLLKNRGLKIYMEKFDPYLNYDPGTMSPYQHGEVFVTSDGGETDLDLGHYERFTNELVTKNSNITTGKIYSQVIEKERRGVYQGRTVQVIPHITNEILSYLYKARESGADVVITEIGGTVGDIESLPFLEAIRQARRDFGVENTFYIHATLVPYLKSAGEIKTKPTQHSVKELRSIGISPDMIVLRSEVKVSDIEKQKIALFCDVKQEAVIEAQDASIIYELVNSFHEQKVDEIICKALKLETKECDLTTWNEMIRKIKNINGEVKIALVGKYISLKDAYLSVTESLDHAGILFEKKVIVKRVESDSINKENVQNLLGDVDGILVPGGFGSRGIEGKIVAAEYARENNIPFFGICLGMQISLIEIARHLAKMKDANSTEFNQNAPYKIIDYLPEQYTGINIGGTLRLGNYDCEIKPNSKVSKYYNAKLIKERHRHRFEFNNEYRTVLEQVGVNFVGENPQTKLVEMIEFTKCDWFVGCQFHPEFSSRPNHPHPLFVGFIEHALKYQNNRK